MLSNFSDRLGLGEAMVYVSQRRRRGTTATYGEKAGAAKGCANAGTKEVIVRMKLLGRVAANRQRGTKRDHAEVYG